MVQTREFSAGDRVRGAGAVAAAGGLQRTAPALLAAIGCVALAVGMLVYMADRNPAHALLFPAIAALGTGPLFGPLGSWLPSLVHPFAFSLLTAAARPPSASPAYRACIAWWAVNVAFEAAQHPQWSATLAAGLQNLLGRAAPARWLADYFLRGTFDVADIVAATAGALAAAGVLNLVHRL
jgi:hypothetical protein